MYAESYRKEGVNIYAVHVQNEPNINSVYPSCLWSAAEIRDFVRDYMGPIFKQRKLDAEIWLGTLCDGNFVDVTDVVLSDPKANAFITGVALQYMGQYQIEDVSRLYPSKKIIQSETECKNGKNSWDDAEYTYTLMLQYLSHGASAYFMWNMVLDETGKSTWDWQQNAMITADTKTGKVVFNPEFYLMQHFSHFIKPGAKRIDLAGSWSWKMAFENPDGSINLIIANIGDASVEQSFAACFADDPRTITFTLPAHSFNTFTIPPLK
jgi:glucosylceramidase